MDVQYSKYEDNTYVGEIMGGFINMKKRERKMDVCICVEWGTRAKERKTFSKHRWNVHVEKVLHGKDDLVM